MSEAMKLLSVTRVESPATNTNLLGVAEHVDEDVVGEDIQLLLVIARAVGVATKGIQALHASILHRVGRHLSSSGAQPWIECIEDTRGKWTN